ncbi:hypothetical protein VTK73DRAFT_6488 [Phialemonium thermophilum]|uniref:DUF7924 domain-containing protein n=1 Tax=Phialemonium thermophilum TaxID=223376 RepID=A0ABR3WJR2_9PEZI
MCDALPVGQLLQCKPPTAFRSSPPRDCEADSGLISRFPPPPALPNDLTSHDWSLMERPRVRKRHRDDGPPQQSKSPANDRKRRRVDESWGRGREKARESTSAVGVRRRWQYPPEFWDRLSEIPLIRSAVAELERRQHTRLPSPFPSPPTEPATEFPPQELARFARHGGPDLRDLRGYPHPAQQHRQQQAGVMSSSARTRLTKSTDPTTNPTTGTTKTKSTTPYNRGFEQHLTDHAIHSTWKSRKPDLHDVRAALTVPRPSLSPSQFPEDAFDSFQENNARAKDEDDVLADVIPAIIGPRQNDHPFARNTVFGNLEPLTDGTIAPAHPDIYYGAYPEELDRSIRDRLSGHIVPSTMLDKPMAPNFFLEVKGPDGSAVVVTRQARYDGAIGSRAMHSLQNYDQEEPSYDGVPATYSSTYHDGTLKLYAHHVTAPTHQDGPPEYHMTQVKGYAMTSDRETFVQGATAFRNVRDLAKQHRDRFIQAANAAALQPMEVNIQADAMETAAMETYDEVSTAVGFTESSDHIDQQHVHNDPSAYTAGATYGYEDDYEAHPASHCPEDHHQEAGPAVPLAHSDDPSMSLTSSFTSGFATDRTQSKRSRPSVSPPSKTSGSHAAKKRIR